MNGLAPGLTVNGIDGRRIGVVAGVGEAGFLIRRDAGPDVCVTDEAVLAVDRQAVSLVCSVEGLNRYEPGASPPG